MESKFLNLKQVRGLNKLGDAMLPGFHDSESFYLPSFSQLKCDVHVDRVLDQMPNTDREDLKLLLLIFSFLPVIVISKIVFVIDFVANLSFSPGIIRFINIGIRGLIMTLYYGDSRIHEKIGYKINVVEN